MNNGFYVSFQTKIVNNVRRSSDLQNNMLHDIYYIHSAQWIFRLSDQSRELLNGGYRD